MKRLLVVHYGGTGILFRRKLAKAIRIVDTNEPRITAVCFTSNIGPVLLANVYMPSDYGNSECYEDYLDICTKVIALFNDSDAVHLMIMGYFNCDCVASSRFYDIFMQ